MPHAVFPLPRILITAAACALVAFLLFLWRGRHAPIQGTLRPWTILALLIGVLVCIWRIVSNLVLFNDDFLPAVSPADVGSGILALVGLLALTPLRFGGRQWVGTSTLVALAVFLCNIVLV
jgi:hypothetical protein